MLNMDFHLFLLLKLYGWFTKFIIKLVESLKDIDEVCLTFYVNFVIVLVVLVKLMFVSDIALSKYMW